MSEIQRLNGELRDRVATLESGTELAELRARNGDLERLAGELKSLNGELRRANARLREATPAASTADEQNMQQELQTEQNRLRARVAELEQALAHAVSDVEALRSAARDAVVGVPSDLAALEQSLRDSKQLLGRARADARAAQQDAEDARGALQAATEALDAADEEQSALRRDADDAREQLVQYKERSSRLVVAESVAATARASDQQRRLTSTAIADAVQRGKRSMAASAAADVARIRAKYIALLAQAKEQQQQQQQPEPVAPTDLPIAESTSNKRSSDAVSSNDSTVANIEAAPAKKRVVVSSGTQTMGWSREHDLDCLRFSHDLLVQKMAEMRGQFVQKLQHMNRLHDALEVRRQNEAQEWNDMLSTTVESLKTQMSAGLKESVLRVRQLQGELESEQQLNERLAGDLEQLRRRTSSESQLSDAGEDVTGAASPVTRAMERLRTQLSASRTRVEELESENELLMEKLVEFESRTVPTDTAAAAAAADAATISPPSSPAAEPERNEEGNGDASESDSNAAMMAAQVDAMECFPSAELMANITVTRRGRGGGRR